jgi:xylulokinase
MFMNGQTSFVTRAVPAAIGVDVGTTNTKVVIVGCGGDGEVRERRSAVFQTPPNGRDLRSAVLAAISTVVADAAGSGISVEAIGIASMAETGAVIDRAGTPLGDFLHWNRNGDTDEADTLVASVGTDALYRATGVPVPKKTPLAHWHRLRSAGDPRLPDGRWCGVADLIASTLTGCWATDHTLAARTMAYRSVPLGTPLPTSFDEELLALVGLTPDRLPFVVSPGEPVGAITASAAAQTGLAAGIPVFIAGHDHAVGAWAAGARTDGDVADSVGTAEALFRVSAAPISRGRAREAGMSIARTVDGTQESLIAGNPMAGGLIDWMFRARFPESDRVAAFAAAEELVLRDAPELFALPYPRGRQAPVPDQAARFHVYDRLGSPASLPGEPAAALAAVLSGLVLHLAWMDAAQSEVLGKRRSDPLPVLGGPGAGNGAWWVLKRAVLDGSLSRVTVSEPVAVGAALLALRTATGQSPVLPSERDAASESGSTATPARAGLPPLADFIRIASGGDEPIAVSGRVAGQQEKR